MDLDAARAFATTFYSHIDSDLEAAFDMLEEDVKFNFGNTPTIIGRASLDAVFAGAKGDAFESVTHPIIEVYLGERDGKDVIAVEMRVTYVIGSGPTIVLPSIATLLVNEGKIKEFRICTDSSPVAAYGNALDSLGDTLDDGIVTPRGLGG